MCAQDRIRRKMYRLDRLIIMAERPYYVWMNLFIEGGFFLAFPGRRLPARQRANDLRKRDLHPHRRTQCRERLLADRAHLPAWCATSYRCGGMARLLAVPNPMPDNPEAPAAGCRRRTGHGGPCLPL